MPLTPHEAAAIEARVAQVEARNGVEVVTALVARSDGYPEVAWKAFALGVAIAALVFVALDALRPDWTTAHHTWLGVSSILAAGAISALFAIAVPEYTRLLLGRPRAAAEVRQYAQALFLERQLFRTRSRNGLLLLASLFERHVEIVADIGFDGRVDDAAWQTVVLAMTPPLREGRTADAFLRALERIDTMLGERGFVSDGAAGDELADAPLEPDAQR